MLETPQKQGERESRCTNFGQYIVELREVWPTARYQCSTAAQGST